MRQIIWSGPAQRDLLLIAARYGDYDPALADDLLDRIAGAPLPLLDFPDLGQAMSRPNTRKWLVRKTPFLLIYGIKGDVIEIKRVRHAAEDWQSG